MPTGKSVGGAWEDYYSHTGTTSSNVRKLGFTGIALVWIFSGGGVGNVDAVVIRGRYLWPLFLMVLALAADFVQYVYLAVAWRVIARYYEIKFEDDLSQEFKAPPWINFVGEGFWILKVILIAVGFAWLLVALSDKVLP